MSDKKVGRFGGRPITPTEQMERALSDPGTVNMADVAHDKGKSVLGDKFREREERWRREQAMHDQQAAHAVEQTERPAAEAAETSEAETPQAAETREGHKTSEGQGREQGGGA